MSLSSRMESSGVEVEVQESKRGSNAGYFEPAD